MRVAAVALTVLAASACTVEPVDFSGRMCPCKREWVCDTATNLCVVSTDFVAEWTFDDGLGDGTAEDSAAAGRDARCDAQVCPAEGEGLSGRAAVFDGVDDRMRVPFDEGLQTRDGFTVSVWLRPDDLSRATPVAKLRDGEQPDAVSWTVELDAAGRIAFGVATAAAGITRVWSDIDSARTGQWVHVAGSWDGATAELYVDGSSRGTADGLVELFQGDLLFGGNAEGPALLPYAGALDEVRLYARVLSAGEIAGLARTE